MKRVIIIIIFILGIISIGYSYYKLFTSKDTLANLKEQYETIEVINIDSSYLESNNKFKEYLLKDDFTKEDIDNYIFTLNEKTETISNSNDELEVEINNLDSEINELNTEYEIIYNNIINATYKIENVINISQYPNYPTGCESVSLYILLKYYNIDVTIEDIVNNLKKGSLPYYENGFYYGGNPYLEFVGNPKYDSGYGTYENSIIEVANKYKTGIINGSGTSLNNILNIVSEGRPVLAWVSINMALPYISDSWIYKPTNETIYWQANEHAVVIMGYSPNSIIASDHYTGIIKYYNRDVFEERYNYFGKRAIYY